MNISIIDGHIDTFSVLTEQNRSFLEKSTVGQADLPRLREGGVSIAFCALSADSVNFKVDKNRPRILSQLDLINKTCDLNSDKLSIIKESDDLDAVFHKNKFGIVIHLEGCQIIEDNFSILKLLYKQGLRSLSLTWNEKNIYATSSAVNQKDGLTLLGKEFIQNAHKLGLLIDVAHLNRPGFWDLVELGVRPLIASHCACQSISQKPYDLTKNQLKAIAESEGIIAIHFVKKPGRELADVVKNILYIIETVGIEYSAIGSDFDGAELIDQIQSAEKLPSLIDSFFEIGMTEKEVEKVCWKNFYRLLQKNF